MHSFGAADEKMVDGITLVRNPKTWSKFTESINSRISALRTNAEKKQAGKKMSKAESRNSRKRKKPTSPSKGRSKGKNSKK
jgi:hypothetical protein